MAAEWRYMPILKWKQGEQLALRNLSSEQWKGISPLIELVAIDVAPVGVALRAALPSYLDKAAAKMTGCIPGQVPVCVDSCYVSPSYPQQLNLLMSICTYLQKKRSVDVVPVIHAAETEALGTLSATHIDFLKGLPSVVLRLKIGQIEPSQVDASIEALVAVGVVKTNIHLLIDQYSLVGRQPVECMGIVGPYLNQAAGAGCGSLTVAGGSFPVNLMGIAQGVSDIPRVEWKVWELLKGTGKYPGLRYADYAVTNPEPPPDLDPTKINMSITIRYASNDFWRLYKGRGFKSGVPGEYRNLCALLVMDPIYSGGTFSYGDMQYMAASGGGEKNGNPMSWRKEATNHHIVLTSRLL
ncbi:hypothetical protein [uncultured Desulfuromusa sp.]|uniref:beta family protein n=1 Tax=uncultured Desulfuromusa sp. TaxID=219183 RepID=UPI002AA73D53|nr:hypothetical protein [uncultured Desulfuromusa sp.]